MTPPPVSSWPDLPHVDLPHVDLHVDLARLGLSGARLLTPGGGTTALVEAARAAEQAAALRLLRAATEHLDAAARHAADALAVDWVSRAATAYGARAVEASAQAVSARALLGAATAACAAWAAAS